MDAGFCMEAMKETLGKGKPEISNTDKGAQFTSAALTGICREQGVNQHGRERELQ